MSKFNLFFDRLIKHEGGYVNHPSDPGGETNWGITKRTALAEGYTGAMRAMTKEQARAIYKKAFWERYNRQNAVCNCLSVFRCRRQSRLRQCQPNVAAGGRRCP